MHFMILRLDWLHGFQSQPTINLLFSVFQLYCNLGYMLLILTELG